VAADAGIDADVGAGADEHVDESGYDGKPGLAGAGAGVDADEHSYVDAGVDVAAFVRAS